MAQPNISFSPSISEYVPSGEYLGELGTFVQTSLSDGLSCSNKVVVLTQGSIGSGNASR